MSYVSDETLLGYGFKQGQWKRGKSGIDHIVHIFTLRADPVLAPRILC